MPPKITFLGAPCPETLGGVHSLIAYARSPSLWSSFCSMHKPSALPQNLSLKLALFLLSSKVNTFKDYFNVARPLPAWSISFPLPPQHTETFYQGMIGVDSLQLGCAASKGAQIIPWTVLFQTECVPSLQLQIGTCSVSLTTIYCTKLPHWAQGEQCDKRKAEANGTSRNWGRRSHAS